MRKVKIYLNFSNGNEKTLGKVKIILILRFSVRYGPLKTQIHIKTDQPGSSNLSQFSIKDNIIIHYKILPYSPSNIFYWCTGVYAA